MKIFKTVPVVVCLFLLLSCEEFVDVDLTNSRVTSDVVFSDDNTALSAMTGVFYQMAASIIYTGEVNSMSMLAGLSADELVDSQPDRAMIAEFSENSLTPENAHVASLWNDIYKVIYQSNALIEGVTASENLSVSVRDRLIGEAKFVRSFCNFYLVNFFGDVPLVTTTDYRLNALTPRASREQVYNQIVADLLSAVDLLPEEYVTAERIHPNSLAASALLAKAYLFMGDWQNADIQASAVIDNPTYEIVQNLDEVFLKGSREAIWQLAPLGDASSTNEAIYYVFTEDPKFLILRNELVDEFESGDNRFLSWIGSFELDTAHVYYYSNKYKPQAFGLPISEYSSVLRLAEQYLIRAEARARLSDLAGAISDLDTIRQRAGLPLVSDINPSIDQQELLLLIEKERRFELFTEWGNRWFDLNRLKHAENILADIKNDFSLDDILYPIPQVERDRNPNLGNQNPGY